MTGHEALKAILMHEVTLGTRKQSIAAWIEEHKADVGAILVRITSGMSLRSALEKPLKSPKRFSRRRKRSQFRNVSLHACGRWYVRLFHAGESTDFGLYASEFEAAAVANIAMRNLRGWQAKVNVL